jgi:hypothetical protein
VNRIASDTRTAKMSSTERRRGGRGAERLVPSGAGGGVSGTEQRLMSDTTQADGVEAKRLAPIATSRRAYVWHRVVVSG